MSTEDKLPSVIKEVKSMTKSKIVRIVVLILLVCGVAVAVPSLTKEDPPPPSIDTVGVLAVIKEKSFLSTVETHYMGLATVTDPKDYEDVLYHVTYDAVLKAGIDFSKVEVKADLIYKVLYVYIPDTVMTDFDIDITSLDYMFIDSKAETNTVTAEAYDACVIDAKQESLGMTAVRQLAEENAKKLIEALTLPFLSVMDEPYTLQILPLET